jgi:hypothetical protein
MSGSICRAAIAPKSSGSLGQHVSADLAPALALHRPSAQPVVTERRDHTARRALLSRVAMEYDEMPALRLTAAQARRLFGLREDICARVFGILVQGGVLECDVQGLYARVRNRP